MQVHETNSPEKQSANKLAIAVRFMVMAFGPSINEGKFWLFQAITTDSEDRYPFKTTFTFVIWLTPTGQFICAPLCSLTIYRLDVDSCFHVPSVCFALFVSVMTDATAPISFGR